MRKLCILALIFVSLVSCGTYTHSGYRVKSILAVTEKGDTIQVPYSTLERNFRYDYNFYNDWRFNYGGTGIIGMYSLTTTNLDMIGGGLLLTIGHLLDHRLNQKQDQEQE